MTERLKPHLEMQDSVPRWLRQEPEFVKSGQKISLTRYFYKSKPLRSQGEIIGGTAV